MARLRSWTDMLHNILTASAVCGMRAFWQCRDHFFWLMKECEASYMMFCDQDDVWHPDKVEKTMRALLEAEDEAGTDTPVLVFTDLTPVDEKLRPIASSLMKMQKQYTDVIDYRALFMQNIVTGCATGINRALAQLAEQCTDTSQVIMHDWWLGVVAARFGRVVYLDEGTMLYRQHGGNSVGAKNVSGLSYIIRKACLTCQICERRSYIKRHRQMCFCKPIFPLFLQRIWHF